MHDNTAVAPPASQEWVRSDTFPPHAHLYRDVAREARETGLLERAPWFYSLVAAVLLLGYAACVTGAILIGGSWFQLLIALGFGICFTQTAFLAHEAAHRQIFAGGRANDRLARVLGALVGMSYSWWNAKHSKHHGNPNKVDKDPDIASDTISFLEKDAVASRGLTRMITKRQGWFFFPLLTLEGINLHAQSYRHLLARRGVRGRWAELAMITGRFAALFIPLFLFLPWGIAAAFLGVQVAVFGVYMGATFAPNHKGMPIVAPEAKLEFFSKQVRMSRNIRGGWWATWLMGGLNHQIEHHLFPSMSRPALAKVRPIVQRYCAGAGIPYTEVGLLRSYRIVIQYLNRVGLAARDPFECPVAARFGRG